MAIRILSSSLTNKIAAGEVIERPASVVKELVENSIDAGAGRIELELEEGGARLIRLVDDGCGMDADDLALAFAGHATSKLSNEEDLFGITTMGFRGEALASIGAVSHARIVARTPESESGHLVEVEGSVISPVKACGAPVGTQVEVRNLFYNVPVRRKFLKTTATEMAHITESVTRLALVRPDIHFVLRHNGRRVFNLPPARDRAQRIGEFFGREIADNLISLRWQRPELEIDGFLLPPSVSRQNTRMQYSFVNGRYVRNKTLMHAVSEAYRRLLTSGRRPVCLLFLTLPPRQVDVNVHPTKLEVRFRQSREVHQQVLAAMRDCLREAKITPQVALTEGEPDAARESVRRAIGDFFAGQGGDEARGRTAVPGHAGRPPAPPGEPRRQVRFGNCVQVLDSFIIEEVADGLNIIDQHALHERILYNQIKRRLAEGRLNSQQLLVPDVVELPKQEFYAVMDLQQELARFGLEMESFGDRSVIVRAFPQILGKFDAKTFFEELLAELEGPRGVRKVDGRLEKIEQMMACRAAVKAGQRLSPHQLQRLLEERAESGETGTCPHGRPTTIHLSRRELDKQFQRR